MADARVSAPITARELECLRFAPKPGALHWPVANPGDDAMLESLETRGLLEVTYRWPDGRIGCFRITVEGLAVLWDHAHESLRHLRPDDLRPALPPQLAGDAVRVAA